MFYLFSVQTSILIERLEYIYLSDIYDPAVDIFFRLRSGIESTTQLKKERKENDERVKKYELDQEGCL